MIDILLNLLESGNQLIEFCYLNPVILLLRVYQYSLSDLD